MVERWLRAGDSGRRDRIGGSRWLEYKTISPRLGVRSAKEAVDLSSDASKFCATNRALAPRQIGEESTAKTIGRTLETRTADAVHWSLRLRERTVGHAPSTIHRVGGPSAYSRTAA